MNEKRGPKFAGPLVERVLNAADQVDTDMVTSAEEVVEALRSADYSLPSHGCDMVMKGGITSGVVYPLAVCGLAQRFKLRNLGGASAGAIAAAAAAAAEHGREQGGFQKLAELPQELGKILGSLFQAQKSTYALMKVLQAFIHPQRAGGLKTAGVLWAAFSTEFHWWLLGVVLTLLPAAAGIIVTSGLPTNRDDWIWVARGLIPLAPLALIVSVVAMGWGLYCKLSRKVPENYFGFCSGGPGHKGSGLPLTWWLSEKLDALAGLKQRDKPGPLTIGDLWGAEAVQAYRKNREKGTKLSLADRRLRKIHLEVMTTDLASGRPWRVPFSDRGFAFCPEEFEALFPPPVVTHMREHSDPFLGDTPEDPQQCPNHDVELRHLPDTPDLPVVFAARISLSFPILIGAIPLYCIDFTRRDPSAHPPVRCWFSDGGISSNFPIHFFDQLWPSRPTFGIDLAKFHADFPESDVYYRDPNRAAHLRVKTIRKLFDFVASIADTMQNWSDRGQMTLPGYRDRIVSVHQTKLEGGMNLSMPTERILGLAARGAKAAGMLQRFNFDLHRWGRYKQAMSELEQALETMHADYDQDLIDDGTSYRTLISAPGFSTNDPPSWIRATAESTQRLMNFAQSLEEQRYRFTDQAPAPDPDLRITPHF